MAGRPPKFSSPEELQKQIDAYFKDCIVSEKMPSKAGLAIHLDCHRDTLNEYVNNKDEQFSDTIKKAYAIIEEAWTQNLAKNNPAGSIFYLKAAFHYSDRIDITTKDKELPTPIIPLDELRKEDDA